MRNNYANTAQLKDLMTVPPMTQRPAANARRSA
jgi:hypothetical protein